jgi:peptidyl-prolyl cis-trans isomerase B (cyclophilin B)
MLTERIRLFVIFWLIPMVSLASTLVEPPMEQPPEPTTRVRMLTNQGEVLFTLYPQRAPLTVDNFLTYVREGFYSGTIFHRIIPGFMVQGGGFTQSFEQKITHDAILNEANNRQPNVRGTLAMARLQSPHSATSQFYINLVNNPGLDYQRSDPDGWGYCVFGKVEQGMSVIEKIANIPTRAMGPFASDYPIRPVIILKMEVLSAP